MKPGDVSGLIRGPGNRFWLLKLLDKKVDTTITFEKAREFIIEVLKNQKLQTELQEYQNKLREKSKIVVSQ